MIKNAQQHLVEWRAVVVGAALGENYKAVKQLIKSLLLGLMHTDLHLEVEKNGDAPT